MRARVVATVIVAGASLAACGIDLFHSTDFQTCSPDPASDACAATDGTMPDGGRADGPNNPDGKSPDGSADLDGEAGALDGATDAPTDFCTWTIPDAHERARRACAWLGACEGPLGPNKFGLCLDNALRAYDCQLNPARKVIGKAHDYWDCLSKVQSCGDVTRCVSAGKVLGCSTPASEQSDCLNDTLLDCPAAATSPSAIVACVGAGQTCDRSSTSYCAGTASACASVPPAVCTSTRILDCVSTSTDVGVDCALFGAGSCVLGGDAGPSCVPGSGTARTPTATISCAGGFVATGCPGGRTETVDCRNLMEDAGTCDTTLAGRPWDVSRGCRKNDALACTEACGADGGLTACHRDKPVEISCALYGLKACATVTHLLVTGVACTP